MNKSFQDLDDNKLIALCRQKNEEAYSALVGRYLFAVRFRASCYVGSDIDFEDLVQEGLIGLINAVKNYSEDFDTSFATFAHLCIDRNIISAVRKSLAKKQIPKSAFVFIEDDCQLQDINNDNPETVIISKENLDALKKRIDSKLSATEQNVLNLYLMGYSYEKIAEKLNCTKKSVDNAIQRLRKKLK